MALRRALSVSPEAWDDAGTAAEYYSGIDDDLAYRFIEELVSALSFLWAYPLAGHPFYGRYRCIALKRFPYLVCYRVAGDTIRVLTIVHGQRDPEWIHGRIDGRV